MNAPATETGRQRASRNLLNRFWGIQHDSICSGFDSPHGTGRPFTNPGFERVLGKQHARDGQLQRRQRGRRCRGRRRCNQRSDWLQPDGRQHGRHGGAGRECSTGRWLDHRRWCRCHQHEWRLHRNRRIGGRKWHGPNGRRARGRNHSRRCVWRSDGNGWCVRRSDGNGRCVRGSEGNRWSVRGRDCGRRHDEQRRKDGRC